MHSGPDLEVRVDRRVDPRDPTQSHLHFTLRDTADGHHSKSFRSPQALVSPETFVIELCGDLPQLLRKDGQRRLTEVGRSLARRLLPETLQQLLWERSESAGARAPSLWLLSDLHWLPWELLRLEPCKLGRGRSGRFLGEAYALTRWPTELPRCNNFPLHRLALVGGTARELPQVENELAYVQSLHSSDLQVRATQPDKDEILTQLDSGDWDALHFAGHGYLNSGIDPARDLVYGSGGLKIDAQQWISPENILDWAPGFAARQPFLFLNACHAMQGRRGFAGLEGWAAHLPQLGASALVGPLIQIGDRAALEFARHLYPLLLRGESLGEAVRRTRLEVRRLQPDSADWLAFVAFGYPLAVRGKPEEPEGDEQPVEPQTPSDPTVAPEASTVDLGRHRETDTRFQRKALRWQPPGGWLPFMVALTSLVLLLPLTHLRAAAEVEIELILHRIKLTVGGGGEQTLLGGDHALERVQLSPVARADLPFVRLRKAGSRIGMNEEAADPVALSFQSEDHAARLSLASARDADAGASVVASLPRLHIEPGTQVVLASRLDGSAVNLEVSLSPWPRLEMVLAGGPEHRLRVEGWGLEVSSQAEDGDLVALDADSDRQLLLDLEMPEHGQLLTVYPSAEDEGFSLFGSLAATSQSVSLLGRPLSLDGVDLLDRDLDGSWTSSLSGPGRLRFLATGQSVELAAGNMLGLEASRQLVLRSLSLDPSTGYLHAGLSGRMNKLQRGLLGNPEDLRLKRYQLLSPAQCWLALSSWLGGVWLLAIGVLRARTWPRLGGPLAQRQRGVL